MQIEQWPLENIREYENNPRQIPQSAIDKVAASLKAFGWRQPLVVDENGVLLAGHTRLRSAKQLGWTHAPVHVAEGLSEAQKKAFRLADNRTHDEAKHDATLVGLELLELRDEFQFDLKLTGFDDFEIRAFLAEDTLEKPEAKAEEGEKPKLKNIRVTEEQHEIFTRALQALRSDEADTSISEGRAVELWAAEYLSGSRYEVRN